MPPRKMSKRKSGRKGRRAGRRNLRNTNARGGPNTCTVIETVTNVPIPQNTGIRINKLGITGTRASAIAPNFGFYRIAKIIFTYKPLFDTYSASLVAGNAPINVPYLYWKMNRYADAPPAFNADYLRSQGSKGIRLDDKNVVVSYKPNVLIQNGAAGLGTSIKMTPWLSTDNRPDDGAFALSTQEHLGHLLFVEGAASGTGVGTVANMDVTVVYEFKNPRTPDASSVSAPVESQVLAL